MKTARHMALLGVWTLVLALYAAAQATNPAPVSQSPIVTANPAPTAGQIHALLARVVENQHRNDRAIEEFDRVEHVVLRKDGENSEILSDSTNRVLPSGTGTMKIQMAEKGLPVSQELQRRQLEYAVDALARFNRPNERMKQDLMKFEKRRRDRAEMLDESAKAFLVTWGGRETRPDPIGTRGARTLAKLFLEPDPNFKPTSRLGVLFAHVHLVLWVDESQAQIARLDADITSDITFGGGIIAKVYRGGHVVMEQAEVALGIWLPTLLTYNVDGRKFLFAFGIHERTEVTRYRHVGPPAQSIEIIRNELNNMVAETPTR